MSLFTRHGGALEAARQRFGEWTGPWLDLSTGINPDPWPGADAVAIDWSRLPEAGALADLEAAAAVHFGVDPAHVCALPGTEVGLRIAGTLLPEPGCFAVPSYRTHAEMIASALPVARRDVLSAPADGTLILANPNNPDGHVFTRPDLDAIMAGRGPEGWLVLDEAFADPDPSLSMAGAIADDRRLLIFRSFGKFFGLAGVRLGFALGPRPLLAQLRARLGDWPVSAAAIAIGAAAYRDTGWIIEARERLHIRALALDIRLRRVGLAPVGECPLFRLVETADAEAMFGRLAAHGILTRPFEDQPHWLRIGTPGEKADYARLERALADG